MKTLPALKEWARANGFTIAQLKQLSTDASCLNDQFEDWNNNHKSEDYPFTQYLLEDTY